MELHEHLHALGLQVGHQVFDDPEGFRGVLDDYLDEDDATTGDINLLVDALRLGAFRSMITTLDSGADAARAVEEAGARLARDRGSADAAGAQWACAVLGFAVGRVGAADVLRFRTQAPPATPAAPPVAPPAAAPTAYPPPTQSFASSPTPSFPPPQSHPAQQSYPPQPTYQPAAASWGAPAGPAAPTKSRTGLIIGVGGTVVAVVVAVVLALVIAGGGDDEPGRVSPTTSSEPTSEPTTDATEPTTEATTEATVAPVTRITDEAATGFTTALLAFSTDFTTGGEALQAATTADDGPAALEAALLLRQAVYDLDIAVRQLDLVAIQPTVNEFLDQSGLMISQLDDTYATATTATDVNLGVASLPTLDYTDSFQAVGEEIDANRAAG